MLEASGRDLIHTYIQYVTYNVIVSFRFGFVYTERSTRLNGRSVSSVCFTSFWNRKQMITWSAYTIRCAIYVKGAKEQQREGAIVSVSDKSFCDRFI